MAHISLSSQKTVQTFQTDNFKNGFKSLNKQYHKKVKTLIEEITQYPLRKSIVMKEDYKDLRRRKKGRVRILYSYCKDCRERGVDLTLKCPKCSGMVDETILFFYVDLRGILY